MWSTQRLNDIDPCTWCLLQLRRRRDGIPAQQMTHHFQAQPWALPEPRPAEGTCG